VATVRPGDGGQLLNGPVGLGRIHPELGDGNQIPAAGRPGGDRVETQSLVGYPQLVRPDPGRVPALRLLVFRARGILLRLIGPDDRIEMAVG
jgi:hypothetical protein